MKWKKEKGKQGRKVIDIEIATGKGIPKGRFVLYAVNEVIGMWVLYDSKKEIQHYIMRHAAENKVNEILRER